MTYLYTKPYYYQIKKQRQKLLTIYLILLGLALLGLVGIILFYAFQPYGTNLKLPLQISMFALIVVFTLFSGVYLTIIYGRVNKYYHFLNSLSRGKKLSNSVTVISINYGDLRTNFGVDFYTMEVLEWSSSQDDYVKHNLLIDNEFKNLDINEGDMLTVTSSLNVLMEYNKN